MPRYVIVLSGDPDPFEHTRTTLRSDSRFTEARAGLSTPWTLAPYPYRSRSPPRVPVQFDAQTRPRQVFALAVAGLLRSDGRVGQELAYLLRTAAGDGDLGSPLERLLA